MRSSSNTGETVAVMKRDNEKVIRGFNGSALGNDASFDADDSEAETERLHESPTKKRLAEEVAIDEAAAEAKRLKVDSPGTPAADNDTKQPADDDEDRPQLSTAESVGEEASKSSQGEDAESSGGEAADENDDDAQASDRETNEERVRALKALTEIEVEFARVRDSLHDQQIAKFDLEIMMCSEGNHPELEQYNTQIDEEYNARLQRTRSLLAYQMNAIFNQSQASRSSVYQTYLKNKFQLRTQLLDEVTRRWYQVNYERRKNATAVPDYGYVASGRPHKVRRSSVQNLKITHHKSVLDFPVAPHMSQVTDSEREADLHDIGLR